MGQRHILHCDCNCFYASVEMQVLLCKKIEKTLILK